MTGSTCTESTHVPLAEADPLTLARRMMRHYVEGEHNRPMSDICKRVYAGWMRDHVSDPDIAAFVELHGLQAA